MRGRSLRLSAQSPPRCISAGPVTLRNIKSQAAFFSCLTLAQRALCAAAILRRAATDNRGRVLTPMLFPVAKPLSAPMAPSRRRSSCCIRFLSFCNPSNTCERFDMYVPLG